MPTKGRSTQPPSDDNLFNNALPTFIKNLENLFDKRADELRHRISEVIVSKARLGQIIDPVHPRYALYIEHAEKIGQDFLSAFDSIIRCYCGVISYSSKIVLVRLFYDRYRVAITREEASLRALAASLGRNRDFKSMFLPAQGIYQTSQSTYFKRLEEEILKHNLELSVRGIERAKIDPEERPTSRARTSEHIAKHKIVKDGVDKLLASLLLEDPSTTKEKAKRLYAHQTNDTYGNVNKLYHYKPKK